MSKRRRPPVVRQYEYRLVWGYKGVSTQRTLIAQRPQRILRMLRRLASPTPEMGATLRNVRKAWARYSMMNDLPFEAVKDLTAVEVLRKIQQTYPELDFLRVEIRQVGAWTELLNPEQSLTSPSIEAADARLKAALARIDAMSPLELDRWRTVPKDYAATLPRE